MPLPGLSHRQNVPSPTSPACGWAALARLAWVSGGIGTDSSNRRRGGGKTKRKSESGKRGNRRGQAKRKSESGETEGQVKRKAESGETGSRKQKPKRAAQNYGWRRSSICSNAADSVVSSLWAYAGPLFESFPDVRSIFFSRFPQRPIARFERIFN